MRLRLFNKKSLEKDVIKNPEVIYDSKVSTSELLVHGLKLGDSTDLIPLENVLTTTFHKDPDEITRFTCQDNKVYYYLAGKTIEYLLSDRINSVLTYGGILHMKTGAKYVIKDKVIVGIGIHNDILNPFRSIKKKDIQKKFGVADLINEDYEEVDGTLFHTTFIYKQRQMKILFSEWDQKILFINLGEFYD